LSCKTNDDCLPFYAPNEQFNFKMVLVAPVSPAKYWSDILPGDSLSESE